MKSKLKVFIIIIIIGLLSVNSFADTAMTTIKKFLWALSKYKHNSTNAAQIVKNKQITRYCDFVININYMGRQAMRDNWSRLTPSQRSEYMTLLTKIVRQIVYRDASNQLNDMRIRYRGQRQISARRWKVTANIYIISERIDMRAEYILEKTGNFFKLLDIYFDGESLIEDYRIEFNRIIRQHGVSGRRQSLLNRMRRTLRTNVIDDARKKRRQKKRQQRRSGRR